MFSFIAGVRPSSPAISSQHLAISSQNLLGQARAHQAMGNLEEAKKSYRDAIEKAKIEHEKKPGDRQAKKTLDEIGNEFVTFLSELQEPAAAANVGEHSPTSPTPNQLLPISQNEVATQRPLSAQRALDASLALSNGIKPDFLEKRSSLSELGLVQTAAPAEKKSKRMDYLFGKALSTLGALKVANKPSLFLVYAHDNPAHGKAEASTSKYLIEKLSQIQVILYSDQTPMGQPYSSVSRDLKKDGKLEDILTNQLCLLPGRLRGDVAPVDKVTVCCSEVLGSYLKWSDYGHFYQKLREAYRKDREAYLKDSEQDSAVAIREVVREFSQEESYKAGFHHVLTEMAFLQIRAEELKDKHGIIPVALTWNSYDECLSDFVSATAVRMEDIPRFEEQAQAGREVYANQSRHEVLFKLIERLLAGSDEAQMFLNKFWQGYSDCISHLKNDSKFDGLEFTQLVDSIFDDIRKALHNELALTVQQLHQQLKIQQEKELKLKKEPLAILGESIQAAYFKDWEELGEIQDGLAMYIALQGKLTAEATEHFDLEGKVNEFLDSDQKVLLLLGEGGSGKSTFNRYLARRLWKDYTHTKNSQEKPMPLFISLATLKNPGENLIEQYLEEQGLSKSQIEDLRKGGRFIFILDGYDEIAQRSRAFYADNKLERWQAKVIISSRPEYLGTNYQNKFYPVGKPNSLQECRLVAFSNELMDRYIDKYVEYRKSQWEAEEYKKVINEVGELKELVRTPFMLKMTLEVLPTLKVEGAQSKLTRIGLYEKFVENWLNRSQERLGRIKLKPKEQEAFEALDEEFTSHGWDFSQNLALAMYARQLVSVTYSEAKDGKKPDWRTSYLGDVEEKTRLLRFNAPLSRQKDQYRFIHKSIQDYLVARAVWEELENFTELASSNHSTQLNWVEQVRVLWEALSPSVQVNAAALLNTFNVVEDLAIQRFLVERVQQNGGLLKPLLAWIKASTSQNSVSIAAANAITILVQAGVQFNELDLKGIQIPGADLSFGVFDSAQLQGADLSQVNFRNSWLRHADLSEAKMAGVRFGEWAYLQEEDDVYSCAYSPDGKNCAVGLGNCQISIYSTSSWEKTYTLEGHTSYVSSVVYSPSGAQIASGSYDWTVRLWDANSGAPGLTLRGHTKSVYSVVYSPSGSQIASGSEDKTVRVWDAQSGAAGHTLEGHTYSVWSVVYSPSGSQIASGSVDKTVRLWDAQSGALGHTLEGHTDRVNSVVYSPSGLQIASGSSDKTVRLWDAQSGAAGHTLKGHTSAVWSVVYSPSGAQIASGGDTTVRLWDAQSGALGHTLEGHTYSVNSVVYSPSGAQIASGSFDKTVRLWDAQSGAAGHTLEGHTVSVRSVVYSPSGSQIASGSGNHTVRVWDAQSGAAGHTLEGHTWSVSSVVYSPSGAQIASGGDTTVRLWDANSGAPGLTLTGHTSLVRSVVYSPSGAQIASGSYDTTVRVWDAQSGAAGHTLEGHTSIVNSVVYSPSGLQIASGSSDKTVRLWDAESGAAGHTLEGHTSIVNSVVYSPSGSQIASGSWDKTVRLWDAQSGAAGHTLEGHTDYVYSVVYSPSGLQIASGSWDKTVHLWEVASGECLRVIRGFTREINSVAWKATPEGSYLLTGSRDKLVRQWELIGEVDEVRVRLSWMSPHAELNVKETLIEEVVGLSEMNRALLEQRGKDGEFDEEE